VSDKLERSEHEMTDSSTSDSPGSAIIMHQLPTEEALHWARLYQREQAAQAERDHLAGTRGRRPWSRSLLAELTEGPLRMAAVALFLIELLAIAAK
jgi:hypothetical protein